MMRAIPFMSLLLFTLACKPEVKNPFSFSAAEAKELTGEELSIPLPLMSPNSLYLLPGNLVVADKYEGALATRIPVGDPDQAERVFRVGNGPDEFLKLSDLYYDAASDELAFVDGVKRICYQYRYNQQLHLDRAGVVGSDSYQSLVDVFTVVPFRGGYFVNGCFGTKMFAVFEEGFHRPKEFGDFPGNQDGIGTRAFFLKNQTILAVDPSGRYFCSAGVYSKWLSIYQTTGESLSLNKELFWGDADVETRSERGRNGTSSAVNENERTMRVFQDLFAGERFLYALYWGINAADMDKADTPCYVIKYSYAGEQVDCYSFNALLYSIAVDEGAGKLYAITYSPLDDAKLLAFRI